MVKDFGEPFNAPDTQRIAGLNPGPTGNVSTPTATASAMSAAYMNSEGEAWDMIDEAQSKADQEAFQNVVDQYSWTPPKGEEVATQVAEKQLDPKELIDQASGQVSEERKDTPVERGEVSQSPAVKDFENTVAEAVKASGSVEELVNKLQPAVATLSNQAQVQAAQGTAAQGQLTPEATVQYQMAKLMTQFSGGAVPAWAAGAMRAATTAMAQRGLGASSMAAMATTQAAMEAAMPIAMQDAQAHQRMIELNLANMQEMALANLSNEQQARFKNAESFLEIDMANFSAQQQVNLERSRARIDTMLSDVAMQNAVNQFNAANENQANLFKTGLIAQIEQFNAEQLNAMSQFNAGQSNAIDMFYSQMQDEREKFNADNRLIIDQANANWRRQISTDNNATINEANRLDAQFAFGLSQAELNNWAQAARDSMNFAFSASESAKDRAVQLFIADMDVQAAKDRSKEERREGVFEAAGKFVSRLFFG